jgi:formate hydrogenlyase subunit 3/multisubunit Na+/H+ antiporter MnhD subunit
LVLIARNGVLFLAAWEGMALASFFPVVFENEKAEVRKAGWIYLTATHLGTAFLLVLFVLWAQASGSFDFDGFGAAAAQAPALAGLLFVLAVVGFGTKAGFMPLHVWLPEAHPAAPSHVSAVMSGVMIKTGIYGLVRMLTLLGPPPLWWGWVLIGIGATSGVLGVLFALAQHDLKRLLAYHSVENIGIITLGLGLGLLGLSSGRPALAVLGFGGGLLHVLNHALFKGLLFFGAGAAAHGSGTREMDRLGGLLKRMPWTGAAFLVGAAAICGLPPLNGFISEFLIYWGAFNGAAGAGGYAAVFVPTLALIGVLALIGGLAAACFIKAFGIVFLGEPRSKEAGHAHEVGWAMRRPMLLLAGGCAAIGLWPAPVLRILRPLLNTIIGTAAAADPVWGEAGGVLTRLSLGAGVFSALVGLLLFIRARLLAGRPVEETVTWDCGYARPTARMQYTASSFAQPLTSFFHKILRTEIQLRPPEGLFPKAAALSTHAPDWAEAGLFRPLFTGAERLLSKLRPFQEGRVQVYVLYIVLTLIALVVWKMR